MTPYSGYGNSSESHRFFIFCDLTADRTGQLLLLLLLRVPGLAYGKPTRDCRIAISPALEKSPPPPPFAWNFHLASFQYEEDWGEALLGTREMVLCGQ
eukprot:sb/3478839/